MQAQAQLPGKIAIGKEKDKVHTTGPHSGTFFVSGPTIIDGSAYIKKVDGQADDYGVFYMAALEALMEQDPRVKSGHAFRITIC